MPLLNPNNPAHLAIRDRLRRLGPLVLGLGLLLTLVGVGSFFASMGSFELPHYFWCAFLGLPLMFFGGAMCQFGYMGAVARYVAEEGAPVATDTLNYAARETQPGVRAVATAVAQGLHDATTTAAATQTCPRCQTRNDPDARFCKSCGEPLVTP